MFVFTLLPYNLHLPQELITSYFEGIECNTRMWSALSRSVKQVRLIAEVQEYAANLKSCDHFVINSLFFAVKAAEKA